MRRRATGNNSDLGSRSRAARQRVQDGRWRPKLMDACLTRQTKTRMRVENLVRIAVQISLSVAYGRGGKGVDSEI